MPKDLSSMPDSSPKTTDIRSIAHFDRYSNGWPSGIDGRVADAVGAISQTMRSSAPLGVKWVVVWPTRPWKYLSRELLVYVMGSFASRYDIMKAVAQLLSSAYRQVLILPTVVPVNYSEWNYHVETRCTSYRRIRDRGVLIYDTEREARRRCLRVRHSY